MKLLTKFFNWWYGNQKLPVELQQNSTPKRMLKDPVIPHSFDSVVERAQKAASVLDLSEDVVRESRMRDLQWTEDQLAYLKSMKVRNPEHDQTVFEMGNRANDLRKQLGMHQPHNKPKAPQPTPQSQAAYQSTLVQPLPLYNKGVTSNKDPIYSGGDPQFGDICEDNYGHQFQVISVRDVNKPFLEIRLRPYNFNWAMGSTDRSIDAQVCLDFIKSKQAFMSYILPQGTPYWADGDFKLPRFVYVYEEEQVYLVQPQRIEDFEGEDLSKRSSAVCYKMQNWQADFVTNALVEITGVMVKRKEVLEPHEEEKFNVFLSNLKLRAEIEKEVQEKIQRGEKVRTTLEDIE
jgi:hypothetical protein